MRRLVPSMIALAAVCIAEAQIALPPVNVPRLPPVNLPVEVDKTVARATGSLDPQQLIELRRLRVRELLREQRRVVEADPRGAPMVRAEVTAFSPSPEALERALAAGFAVVRERALEGLGARIVVLRAPPRMSTRQALKRLRALDEQGVYDFNHIYLESGVVGLSAEDPTSPQPSPPQRGGEGVSEAGGGGSAIKLGLIDGGVDVTHPVFASHNVRSHGCQEKSVPSAHGTAVASLLAGQAESFRGAAPQSELYAVDIYCGEPTGGAVDAVAEAFAWLSRERVGVINVSLVGPANAMLENIIRLVRARGHLIVAAVGNDGPAAPPLYPAAYPGVIGVTGVDGRHRVLLEALRGKQVDFSAPGADLTAASLARSFAPVRGTSFAAPIVAGLLANAFPSPDPAATDPVIAQLAASAVDLGARGPDPVYGQGFVAIATP